MQVHKRSTSGRRPLHFLAAAAASVAAAMALPAGAMAGGVFVTGHDPDYHAVVGGNPTGAQHIIQQAINYVTFGNPSPRVLLVTDLRNPGGDESDSRLGLTAAGYTYDVADYGSGTPGVLDLHTVNFSNYDVVVVASDYGGWLRQDELDILNARSSDLIAYVNGGGGLVAFAEGGDRATGGNPLIYPGTSSGRYGFLPFLTTATPLNQTEVGYTVTPAGAALGLTDGDINGNASHNIFTATGGMDVIDRDASGEDISLATRTPITPTGVDNPPDCSHVTASPGALWPPNHRLVPVTLSGATDPDGDPLTLTVTGVTQDEPVDGVADGHTSPDAQIGPASDQVSVRAERSGQGDGRVYHIAFTVADGKGLTCTGTATVGVPHDQRGAPAVDSGQTYNSLG
jgi:hypothetical protein